MKERTWRLLDLEFFEDPYFNMAVEEAIPRKVGEGVVRNTLRFWRNKNTIVIGRFQKVTLEVNLEACKKYGTTIVRRFTGGGAVYHDQGNLNYAISLPKEHPLIHNNISINFRNFLLGFIEGLEVLGLKVEFKPINKIEANGRKISGAAGCLRWGAFFLHGSMLVSSNLNVLSEVLDAPQDDLASSYVRSIRDRVTTIHNELRTDISIKEVKQALKTGFERSYRVKLIEGMLGKQELTLAEELYQRKYSKEKWNSRAESE